MDGTTLLNFLSVAIGTFGGIMASSRLTNYRIEKLEEEVRKYNNVKDRTTKLEEYQKLQDEKMKVANHRISDVEDEIKKR